MPKYQHLPRANKHIRGTDGVLGRLNDRRASVSLRACVCVCVVCVRERERERESLCVAHCTQN